MSGVTEGARQLAAVDMSQLTSGAIEIEVVSNKLAPKFTSTFRSLLNVISIQEMKQCAKEMRKANSQHMSSGMSSSTMKRAAEVSPPVQTVQPRKRSRGDNRSPSPLSNPKTPDQPTHPSNPNWTGGTEESKDEENTKALLKQVVTDSMSVLELDFRKIFWQRSG